MNFEYVIRPKQSKCFEEFFVKGSGIYADITTMSNSQPIMLRIKDENSTLLYEKYDDKHKYTKDLMNKSQSYTFCIDNPNGVVLKLMIDVKSGYEADAILDKLKHHDHVVNSEVQRYIDASNRMMKLIENLSKEANLLSDVTMGQLDDIPNQLIWYTGLTIILLVIIGYLYTTYMVEFLKQKKLV